MKKIFMIEINQPIGTFYIGKMNADDIISISRVSQRKGGNGHQRQLKEKRAKEIAMYCNDPDATFPTPIIMAVPKDSFVEEKCEIPGMVCFSFDNSKKIAELLDGQHRIAGISRLTDCTFELPVIIMFDLSEAQKAYVFSTINGNQVKVDRSLIYDLFALSESRSPYKTCHQIARAMNSEPNSPFFKRLKMLEQRSDQLETISQNTFVTQLSLLISKNPQQDEIDLKRGRKLKDNAQLPLRKYFINERDDVILRIMTNYFQAASSVFSNEWNNPQEFILTKSVGFSGLMKALEKLIPIGENQGTLSCDFFIGVFEKMRVYLNVSGQKLTSQYFSSSIQEATRLARIITEQAFEL